MRGGKWKECEKRACVLFPNAVAPVSGGMWFAERCRRSLRGEMAVMKQVVKKIPMLQLDVLIRHLTADRTFTVLTAVICVI